MKCTIVKLLLTITAMAIFSASYAEFAYFDYVEEPVNARSIGLGGAGTAYCTGGFSYYNPAAAATAENSFVALDFGKQWDRTRGSVETAWIFEKWFFGASFLTKSVEFQTTDVTGVLGSASDQESMFSLLTGWKTDRYTIAAAANGLYHSIVDENAFALTASGGVTVSVLPGKLNVGAALLHAGRYHRGFFDSTYSPHRDSMATSARAGFQWRDTVLNQLPVSLSADVVYSRSYEKVLVPIGIEVTPLEPLSIRIGKRFNHHSDLFTFGIGLSWENIAFDAAYVPTTIEGDFDSKWLIGLRYSLHHKKRPVDEHKTMIHADTTKFVPLPDSILPAVHTTTHSTARTGDDTATVDSTLPAPILPDSLIGTIPGNDSAPVIDTTNNPVELPAAAPGAVVSHPKVADSTAASVPTITDKKKETPPEKTAPIDSMEKSPLDN